MCFSRLALSVAIALTVADCARSQCTLNSDCQPRGRCISNQCFADCLQDRDCPAMTPYCDPNGQCVSLTTDAGNGADVTSDASDVHDATVDAPMMMDTQRADISDTAPPPTDNTQPPVDNGPPPDQFVPPPDVPTTGTGAYLDRCTASSDCASGLCVASPGASFHFCSRSCASHDQCAHGQRCIANVCRLDDTGLATCDTTTSAPCNEACFGTPQSHHCTHTCTSAADCPGGYACSQPTGATVHVCMNVEPAVPCTQATDCPSAICITGRGCSAVCQTGADCPSSIPGFGLAPYTCQNVSGQMLCVPPTDAIGAVGLGGTCNASSSTNPCISNACDTTGVGDVCVAACTPRGGCPMGYGCRPDNVGSAWATVCYPGGGSGWLRDPCARSVDCYTGICNGCTGSTAGYCTRVCDDGLCPSGMTCTPSGATATNGIPLSLCVPSPGC